MKLLAILTFILLLFLVQWNASVAWAVNPDESQEFTGARSILIFSPHPDDEALMSAGIIRSAVKNSIPIKVVIVTNGDYLGQRIGYRREAESVKAMKLLGLSEDHVIFLGYADQLMMKLYKSEDPDRHFVGHSRSGHTYAAYGMGKADYHQTWAGRPAPYTRANVISDFIHLFETYKPDAVFTTSRMDSHPDHQAVQKFVLETIQGVVKENVRFRPTLYEGLVHAPNENFWPYSHPEKIPMPRFLASTPDVWNQTVKFRMDDRKLKRKTVKVYQSQLVIPWLMNFAKSFEAFWAYSFDRSEGARESEYDLHKNYSCNALNNPT